MTLKAVLEITLVVLGIVATGIGLASLLWAVGKVKGLELTVDLLRSGNEALRAELADAGRRHADELARLEQEYRTAEASAADRISRLEGQNAALLDGIAERVATRIEQVLVAAVERLVVTVTTREQ